MNGGPSAPARGGLAAAWARLAERERRLVLLAASVLGLALIWLLAVSPALRTLRQAEALRAALAAALADGEYSVRALQASLALPVVTFDGLRFGNLNTPADLLAAGCTTA